MYIICIQSCNMYGLCDSMHVRLVKKIIFSNTALNIYYNTPVNDCF